MAKQPSALGLVRAENASLANQSAQILAKRGLTHIQSTESAKAWFQLAMKLFNKQHPESQPRANSDREYLQELRDCLLKVVECDPCHEEALNALAAVEGDAQAQFRLASHFCSGFSTSAVPEDIRQAEYWFNLSSIQGIKPAILWAELCRAGFSYAWMERVAAENNCRVEEVARELWRTLGITE